MLLSIVIEIESLAELEQLRPALEEVERAKRRARSGNAFAWLEAQGEPLEGLAGPGEAPGMAIARQGRETN